MNKQELIKRISELPYSEGPIADTVTVNRNWILGSIEQLDEPQKVTVPQFVADYIRYAIENDWDFQDLFKCIEDEEDEKLLRWTYNERNQETLAAAWINGYTVEKEKRYIVKMSATKQPLFYNSLEKRLFFSLGELATQFTFEQLEEAGFGEVFDSPLFEVEEAK